MTKLFVIYSNLFFQTILNQSANITCAKVYFKQVKKYTGNVILLNDDFFVFETATIEPFSLTYDILGLMNGNKEIGDNIISHSDARCGVIKSFFAEIDDRPFS